MLLYLLRHGETDWNVEQRIQGVSDIALNEVGVAQAEALACALRGRPIARVYTSPLGRARQTAEVVARGVDAPLESEAGIAELDQGELEGLAFRELSETHPRFHVRVAGPSSRCARAGRGEPAGAAGEGLGRDGAVPRVP